MADEGSPKQGGIIVMTENVFDMITERAHDEVTDQGGPVHHLVYLQEEAAKSGKSDDNTIDFYYNQLIDRLKQSRTGDHD